MDEHMKTDTAEAAGGQEPRNQQDPRQDEIARLREEHRAELDRVRIDGEVRVELTKMGARNPTAAAKILDLADVHVEDGTVVGVESSVKRLMDTDPYLFSPRGTMMEPGGGSGSTGGVHGTAWKDPEMLSDKEYYRMVLGK